MSIFFNDYIDKCFNSPENVKVLENGIDVTDSFFDEYSNNYLNNSLKEIQEYLCDDNVQISYKEFANQTRATESKSVTYQHYKAATDTTGKFTKEWIVNMQCYITWDANKYKITSYNTPILYLSTASWGTNWSPYITNVSTDAPVVNSDRTAVTFSAGYTMKGSYSYFNGISETYSFGSYRISDTFYV
ncbi:MAG: hypothetical protein PUH10_01445 [Erysipelotrichaceae bacterium]|uniref:hypothetical protein n=1 Tax=Floccifex sp. TaxID=2815810 RepID=UPI002A74DAFA|nr:hypothetical protein [Floccifex sp.]MDD7280654.1 hypothetical protein [Erysipelotrichaceae bacterium]